MYENGLELYSGGARFESRSVLPDVFGFPQPPGLFRDSVLELVTTAFQMCSWPTIYGCSSSHSTLYNLCG